jgi:hypothetical protein
MRYDEKAIGFDEFDDKIGRQLLMNWFLSILKHFRLVEDMSKFVVV